jgi:hypothetical protein
VAGDGVSELNRPRLQAVLAWLATVLATSIGLGLFFAGKQVIGKSAYEFSDTIQPDAVETFFVSAVALLPALLILTPAPAAIAVAMIRGGNYPRPMADAAAGVAIAFLIPGLFFSALGALAAGGTTAALFVIPVLANIWILVIVGALAGVIYWITAGCPRPPYQ